MVNRTEKRALKKVLKKKTEPVVVAAVETEDGTIRFAKAETVMKISDLEKVGDLNAEDADSSQVVALLRALCADEDSKKALDAVALDQLEELMELLEEVLNPEDEESSPKN